MLDEERKDPANKYWEDELVAAGADGVKCAARHPCADSEQLSCNRAPAERGGLGAIRSRQGIEWRM